MVFDLIAVSGGCSVVMMGGLLLAVVFLVTEHGP